MKFRRFIALLATAALMAGLLAPAALADALYGVITTPARDGSVNLRAKAGVTQAVVGWAKNGDEVEVLHRGNSWHKVRLLKNGRVGWMYGKYLKLGASVSTGGSTGAAVSGSVAQIMTKYPGSTVNLRSGAGTGHSVVGQYRRGTRLEILGESGNWYSVRIAGADRAGYMSKNYVSVGLSARTTGRVNLRTGGGTSHSVIRTLDNGQEVTVLWVGENWSKVQTGKDTGYISNKYYAFR